MAPKKNTRNRQSKIADDKDSLLNAINLGNVSKVESLLKTGVSANISWENGETALLLAIKKGSIFIFKLLLQYGADFNGTDAEGRNALYFAASRGNLAVTKDLCEIYSKRGPKWKEGYPALYAASFMGYDSIVDLLIDKGVDLKARTHGFLTPLHAAAERGHDKIVESLLEYGFDVNEKKAEGRTALHCSVENKFPKIVDLLLRKGADVNAKITGDKNSGYTPLHFAVETENLEIVKLLLSNGADVKAKTESNETVLLLSIRNKNPEIVQCIVDHGADVNSIQDATYVKWFHYQNCVGDVNLYKGQRPLVIAVEMRNEAIVEILLNNGAQIDIEGDVVSPFHLAAEYNNVVMVETFLQHGAQINSTCMTGYTALFHAVQRGATNTMIFLIKKGAQLHLKNKKGNNLLHTAVESLEADEKMVKILLDCDADVNARNEDQETPLHCFVPLGINELNEFDTEYDNLYQYLLDYGADVNAQDKFGNTPLHLSSKRGDLLGVRVLLNYDADINIVNQEGKTPLEYSHHIFDFGLLDDCDLHECVAEFIIEVIVRREAAGLYVSKQNLREAKKDERMDYYQMCKRELNAMRGKIIWNNFTPYDILTKNISKLTTYVKNNAIVDALDSTNFERQFPIYAPMLHDRIQQANERKNLLESSAPYLKSILRFEFSNVIVQKIFSFLSNVDLKNMARALQCPGQSLFNFRTRCNYDRQ